jgi:hypothetical protein
MAPGEVIDAAGSFPTMSVWVVAAGHSRMQRALPNTAAAAPVAAAAAVDATAAVAVVVAFGAVVVAAAAAAAAAAFVVAVAAVAKVDVDAAEFAGAAQQPASALQLAANTRWFSTR